MTALLRLPALLALVFVSMTGLSGCATTGLAETWIEPGLTELPRFQKLFVAYLGGDAAAQRRAEDALAARLDGIETVKCYQLLPDARAIDGQQVKDTVRAAGCDGALVLRLARVEQEVSYTPSLYPGYTRDFGGYWVWARPYPGDLRTDEIVHVETTLYAFPDDTLLYTATSETFNPTSTTGLVEEVLDAIAADLKARGLRPPTAVDGH